MGISIDLSRTQQYIEWLKEKLYLNAMASSAAGRMIYRGQVYRCNLGVGIGSEECKMRPCVVLQHNPANKSSSNTIIAPITHTSSTIQTVVEISEKVDADGKIILDGNVLLGNIMCVSKARLKEYVADLDKSEMEKVDEAIALSLDLKHYYKKMQNELADKQTYIEKLKEERSKLREENDGQRKELAGLHEVMSQFGIDDSESLAQALAKISKN